MSLDLIGLRASRVRVDGDRRTAFHQATAKLRVTLAAHARAGGAVLDRGRRTRRPAPRRSRWGDHRLGGARGRRARGRPADRRADVVPVQRPSRRRRRYRSPSRRMPAYTVVATGAAPVDQRAAARSTLASSSRTCRRHVPHGGAHRALRRPRRLAARTSAGRSLSPARAARAVHARFARSAADDRSVRGPVRSVPARTTHARGDPRRTRDPARGAGHGVFGANHIDDPALGAPRRARARAPVVRQQRRRRAVAGHLAQRGFRLLRGVAVVRGSGGPTVAREGRTRTTRGWRRFRRICAARPRPGLDVRRSRLQARRADAARAAATLGDGAFFAMLQTWARTHRASTATTTDFAALAESASGPRRVASARLARPAATSQAPQARRRQLHSDRDTGAPGAAAAVSTNPAGPVRTAASTLSCRPGDLHGPRARQPGRCRPTDPPAAGSTRTPRPSAFNAASRRDHPRCRARATGRKALRARRGARSHRPALVRCPRPPRRRRPGPPQRPPRRCCVADADGDASTLQTRPAVLGSAALARRGESEVDGIGELVDQPRQQRPPREEPLRLLPAECHVPAHLRLSGAVEAHRRMPEARSPRRTRRSTPARTSRVLAASPQNTGATTRHQSRSPGLFRTPQDGGNVSGHRSPGRPT